jgi:hypothetical protein
MDLVENDQALRALGRAAGLGQRLAIEREARREHLARVTLEEHVAIGHVLGEPRENPAILFAGDEDHVGNGRALCGAFQRSLHQTVVVGGDDEVVRISAFVEVRACGVGDQLVNGGRRLFVAEKAANEPEQLPASDLCFVVARDARQRVRRIGETSDLRQETQRIDRLTFGHTVSIERHRARELLRELAKARVLRPLGKEVRELARRWRIRCAL